MSSLSVAGIKLPNTGGNITNSSGSLTYATFDSSGNITIGGNLTVGGRNVSSNLIPSQTGNSGRYLTTDGTSASWVPLNLEVINVVQYGYSSVYENTAQNVEYDMPGVLGDGTASITPQLSTSRILFSAVMHCGQEDTWRGNFFRTYYKIGTGSWTIFGGGFANINFTSGMNGNMNSVTTQFLMSSLSTTQPVYFKITQTGHANGGYLHLNQNNTTNNTSPNNTVNATSTITLMEIAA